MHTLITTIHVLTCVLLVLVVLIQSGKGAEISTSFSGSSQTVFGSSGGANFFSRFTSGAAAVFMITSLTLTLLGKENRKSLFEGSPAAPQEVVQPVSGKNPVQNAAPVAPAGAQSPVKP